MTMTTRQRWNALATAAILAMSATAACAAPPIPRSIAPADPALQANEDANTRGLRVQNRCVDDPGDRRTRLRFDHVLKRWSSPNGLARELRDGDTLVTGDRLRATVQVSADAYVYLAFCAEQKLKIYPSSREPPGRIRASAGRSTQLPSHSRSIEVDDRIEPEVLYVIASRTELSIDDPRLERALAVARRGASPDCRAPAQPPRAQHRVNGAPKAGAASHDTPGSPGPAPAIQPDKSETPPVPHYIRGADDDDGTDDAACDDDTIAVVRRVFSHSH
jgi:hypothetical protein